MSRISDQQTEENISLIRSIMVRYPRISIRKIQEAMASMNKPVFSKDYIAKLQKKIRGERINRFNNYSASLVVSTVLDKHAVLEEELWQIIHDRGEREEVEILDKDGQPTGKKKWKWLRYPPNASARIKAIEALAKLNAMGMDAQFDAGFLERRLGEVGVHTRTLEDELDEYYSTHEEAREIIFAEATVLPEGQSSADREQAENPKQERSGGPLSLKRGTEILLD